MRANQFRQLRHGCKSKILDSLKLRRVNLAETELRFVCVELFPCTRRMKSDCRFGVERYIDLPDRFVRVEVTIDATERHRLLRVCEFDANQFLGLMHHLFRDAQRGRWRRTRRRCWRRRLCESIERQLR